VILLYVFVSNFSQLLKEKRLTKKISCEYHHPSFLSILQKRRVAEVQVHRLSSHFSSLKLHLFWFCSHFFKPLFSPSLMLGWSADWLF